MDITMAMVLDELSHAVECRKGSAYNPHFRIDRVRVVQEDGGYLNAMNTCLVVGDFFKGDLMGVPIESIVHICPAGGEELPCAVVVTQQLEPIALKDALARAMARYDRWASNLMDLSLHGAGLEELVDCAHGLFGNPMTIINDEFRILAQTQEDVMDDVLWIAGTHDDAAQPFVGVLTTEADEAEFSRYLESLRKQRYLRGFETASGRRVSSCLARSNSDTLFGVNVIEKNRGISDGDFECLKFFAKIVGVKLRAMECTWQDSSGSYIALLHDVVRGNLADASEFKARLSSNWISVQSNFTVAVIAAPQGLLRYYQLCRIEDDLSELVPECRGVINSRVFVCFINHEGELSEETLATLKAYAQDNQLVVGVSESRGDDCSLRDLVKQAKYALQIRKKAFSDRSLVEYRDCRKYYLFELCAQERRWEQYVHPCLDIIAAYDQCNTPPLEPTLRCLIDNYGNRTITAKELGIQRNALQYRLSKIEELCGIDLSDPELFDHLSFSLSLRSYCTCAFDSARE